MVLAVGMHNSIVVREVSGGERCGTARTAVDAVTAVRGLGVELPGLVDALHAVVPHEPVYLVFAQIPRVLVGLAVVPDAEARNRDAVRVVRHLRQRWCRVGKLMIGLVPDDLRLAHYFPRPARLGVRR